MKTGEGKTLVGPLAAALNAMSGRGVHVVTVNDYLAKRDPQWMGPIFHGLGLTVGVIQHDNAFLFDPDYRPSDETHDAPAAGRAARGLRRGRHLRHQQRVRLRLPARQHGHRARRAGPARALLRHRGRGRQHPHRRGAHAADHQRPGRGVGRPLLPARAPGAPPEGASGGRRGGRRLLHRPQGARRLAHRGGHRQDREAARGSRTSTTSTRTRGWPATSTRRCAPTRSTSATATTSSRTARSSSSTSSRAARCPAGAGRRASTRRSRPRRACASSASR